MSEVARIFGIGRRGEVDGLLLDGGKNGEGQKV
jgi:hypothetical protein